MLRLKMTDHASYGAVIKLCPANPPKCPKQKDEQTLKRRELEGMQESSCFPLC